MNEPRCRLYLIGPSPLPEGFAAVLADALRGGDVAALRLAAGGMEDADFLAALMPVRLVAHDAGVAVILDGRPDLVARAACDGVHLDAPLPGVRRVLGDLQLGVSCGGSRDLAMQAGEAGADYVSFGPFFAPAAERDDAASEGAASEESDPEAEAYEGATPELVSWWVELMELPAVAEGSITLENCPALIAAGVDFLALDDAVWAHADGPQAAVRAFNAAIRQHAPDA
jgi:thiamine-phosphate pyrophosphorylase